MRTCWPILTLSLLACGSERGVPTSPVKEPVPVAYAAPDLLPLDVLATAATSRPGEIAVVGTGGMARVRLDDCALE